MYKYLTCLGIFLILLLLVTVAVKAQSVNVVVDVGMSPEFVIQPYEDTTSSSAEPVNTGESLTFFAQATALTSTDYYLIVCKSASVNGNVGSVPDCSDGQWCVSSLTPIGNTASCDYTPSLDDSEVNDWHAFACSRDLGYCSGVSQGTGDSGSPFYVNHPPLFTSYISPKEQNPGGTYTWSATAEDTDINGTHSFKLFVCKSANFSNNTCTGGSWCTSSYTGSNPSCSYTTYKYEKDADNSAYLYITDAYGLASNSDLQGHRIDFGINNITPEISNIVLNDGHDITPISENTAKVSLTTTVSDINSCQVNEIKKVTASLYRSGIGYAGCDSLSEANNNNCYPLVNCKLKTGESCLDSNDTTLNYECSFDVWYYADPTDERTVFSEEKWQSTIHAEDDNGSGKDSDSGSIELNSLVSLETEGQVDYGTLNAGQTTTLMSRKASLTSLGNTGLDAFISGLGLNNGQGYEVPPGNQRYSLEMIPFTQAVPLTSNPQFLDLNLKKPTEGKSTKDIYWGVSVPEDIPIGNYSGLIYLTVVKGDAEGW